MKTILYNPIFINPQAYYVFPRLTRYLQPDNESTAEPANYIGTIEVKVIAYGDTTLKRTYTNTDSIDLSEFKNTWIRISLFTKVGSCVLGEWKIGNMESDLPYIDPEVLASLKAVVIVGNKTNNDSDRAIVKNLVDPDNPFVISNAAYEGMSGYNGYPIILSGTNSTYQDKASYTNIVGDDKNIINITRISFNTAAIFSYIKQNGTLTDYNRNIESFKVKVTGIDYSKFVIKYSYISGTNATERTVISITSDGTYELPKSFASDGSLTSDNVWIGLNFTKQSTDIPDIIEDVNVTIEVLPEFEGAFVTDGIDDLITSTKTVQEMLGGSNEITVVSMIHQVKDSSNNVSFTNYIRGSANGYFRNIVNNYDKTGIYGYTSSDLMGLSVVNNILGDKNDYTSNGDNRDSIINGNFNVQGYSYNDGNNTGDFSSVAWYWTIIANKVLTTDQINQVIAYFNLDRTLKSDIYCNIAKQGITNENHAEFGDKLIDFSGNGRDIQLNNIAWNKESGIDDDGALRLDGVNDFGQFVGDLGLKDYTFIADRAYDRIVLEQAPFIASKSTNGQAPFLMEYLNSSNYVYPHSFGATTKTTNLNIQRQISYQSTYVYNGNSISKGTSVDTGDGLTIGNSGSTGEQYSPLCLWSLMLFPYSMSEFLIERQLKKHKLGTLYPDMVEFRPVIKANNDYEIVYTAIIKPNNWQEISIGDYVTVGESVAIQIKLNNPLEVTNVSSNSLADVSFYKEETGDNVYTIYGRLLDGKSPQKITMTIEQDENYVKFEPVITSNVEYVRLDFYLNNYQKRINIGDYIPKDAYLRANFYLKNNVDELTVFTFNGVNIGYRRSSVDDTAFNINQIYNYDSPQEVNITIDEYIRYEDIVQPYPSLLRFNDENGNEVSWGGKFKVGSTITRIGSAADSNLLPNIYNIFGLLLNGNQVTSSKVIVEKTMVFKAKSAYIFDNNEPKCILSPRLLRIPNSSYKILGHIPDISGHGNHGKINNSAYAEGSGVNEDGSYQFDGVDDFVTIPTLSSGGKQVLMKVNWNTINSIIYDQRGSGGFAIYCSDYNNPSDSITVPAYKGRNAAGTTYIDGIRNEYIIASQLRNVTHNIVEILDTSYAAGKTNPIIGKSHMNSNYGSLALYDFMLFDNISTDDKIKQLNEYVGIEGNTDDLFNETN